MKRVWGKRILWTFLSLFVLLNGMAFMHAHRFTHFSEPGSDPDRNPETFRLGGKLFMLLSGVQNERPANDVRPQVPFTELNLLHEGQRIALWSLSPEDPIGTIILFHGYKSNRSALVTRGEMLYALGYEAILVDFLGSGDSDGMITTVGYKEAEQVRAVYDAIAKSSIRSLYMFGNSMGAVAIMKAMHDHSIEVDGLILECPYGSLYETVSARFVIMGLPSFPMAALLTFWGGIQHGFWGFSMRPFDYAQSIEVPTLLMIGSKDDRVSMGETMKIYRSLRGHPALEVFEGLGHEDYFPASTGQWKTSVDQFLRQHQ